MNLKLAMPDVDYYLAGPMSGYPEYNYPAFTAAAEVLRDAGLTIHSPHEVLWPDGHEDFSPEDLWKYMMEETGKVMTKCNGIILLKGWPQSRGARQEMQFALEHEWPAYFYHDFSLYSMNNDQKVMAA